MLCLCTNTSCKWKKLDLGTLDNLLRFFKEEKIISAQSTLFICKKQKNKYKKRKVMLYYHFINFLKQYMVSFRNTFCPIRKISGKDVNDLRCPYMI